MRVVGRSMQMEHEPQAMVREARHIQRKLETMRCGRLEGRGGAEHLIGWTTPTGGWAYAGWRCVNCGAINFPTKAGVPPGLRGGVGGGENGGRRRVSSPKFRRHE